MLSNIVICLQLIPHGGCRNQDESDDDEDVLEVPMQQAAGLEEKAADDDTEEKEEAKEKEEVNEKIQEAKEEDEEKPTITKGTAGPLLLPKMGHLAACLSKMFLLCFPFTMFFIILIMFSFQNVSPAFFVHLFICQEQTTFVVDSTEDAQLYASRVLGKVSTMF